MHRKLRQKKPSALEYLTENLTDIEAGRNLFNKLVNKMGCVIDIYPMWHPILTIARKNGEHKKDVLHLSDIPLYDDIDHTIKFVRGFVTCPYTEGRANRLVEQINNSQISEWYEISRDLKSYCNYSGRGLIQAASII